MQIVLTSDDLSRLKPKTRADIINKLFPSDDVSDENDIDFEDVVGLSFSEVSEFMNNVSEKYQAGLRVIAEDGPVIHASALERAGITNFGHFQGRITLRTRTITGNEDAFLFGWDNWVY